MAAASDSISLELDGRMLEALARLNQIGASINQLGTGEEIRLEDILKLVVESATHVIPGASAVIYTYDARVGAFDPLSRVSAGDWMPATSGDEPRPDGLGMRAITQRRRVLSYEEPELTIHPLKRLAGAQVVACCPMLFAGQPLGILYVYLNESRPFDAMELLLLDNFVNQVAMAIAQAHRLNRIHRDLRRKDDELNRLRRAGLLISSRLRLEDTLEAILQMALEVTGAQYGIFRLFDPKEESLVTRAIAGEHLARPKVETLSLDSPSVMTWVARHRQPALISDLRQPPWNELYYPLDAQLEMRSELAVPLIGASGRLEGVLNLESPEVGAFDEQDSHLLQALATQAVIAIQEVRLLDALQEVAELLLDQPSHQVLRRLAELACELLNAAAGAIWVLEGDRLVLQAHKPGQEHSPSLPLHHSLVGQALLTGAAVTAQDVRSDQRFFRPELAQRQGWGPALVVPLFSGKDREPIGAFGVYRSAEAAGAITPSSSLTGSEWDEKVLTSLGHYAVLAVHNAAHQAALRSAQEQRAVAETFAAVGDIAANLLHHVNNKLGTIPVRVQGIQDKRPALLEADPYLNSNLAEIERSARQAMEIVRESLSFLHPIRLAPTSVAGCIRTAIAEAALPAEVRVQTVGLESLPQVSAGEKGLTLVFVNLLQNAAEAMKGDGLITIQGMARAEWVEVAVSDNGPGVAPELQERIFEFNFSRTPGQTGKLGFGLWWVKTWMARLGGSVQVESDGKNGATFWLRLPYAREAGK